MKIGNLRSLAVAATACHALFGTTVHAAGDPEAGKTAFYTCQGCHGSPGYSNTYPTYYVPKVGGQHAPYIVSALQAYKNGDRQHGSMQGNATPLTDQQMEDIAAYLSSLKNAGKPESGFGGDAEAGKTKAAMCTGCHGTDGLESPPTNPRLAGQYASYLSKALKDYQSGARTNPMMNGFAASLSEQDIADIAAYYATLSNGLNVVK